ncbi:hypothetical protein LIER_08955 [Lithospermum erythrorhizon]|uniref:Uncharacterized protein n=1 Tax=Lithospermum erythrorhizon TaxID=34254 RepID=A0AAV3PEX5_LITER
MYFDNIFPYVFTLSQKCSNNMAEYQSLILGLNLIHSLLRKKVSIPVCEKWVMPPIFKPQEYETEDEEEVMVTITVDGALDDWRQPFIDYLQHGSGSSCSRSICTSMCGTSVLGQTPFSNQKDGILLANNVPCQLYPSILKTIASNYSSVAILCMGT